MTTEGQPPWWVGRASNPVGGAKRRRVGSTPMPFRQSRAPTLGAPAPAQGPVPIHGFSGIGVARSIGTAVMAFCGEPSISFSE